jgi:Domain of unknown function (DUF4440)
MTDVASNELALRRLEQRRSDAMEQCDVAVLDEVFAADFQLVHGDGTLDDKRGAIEAALRIPRRVVVPRELSIRIFGETALLTGPMTLAVTIGGEEKTVRVFISQVARLERGRWQFVWSQVTLSER